MENSRISTRKNLILCIVTLVPFLKTLESFSILKPCVNCEELHVKLGRNLPMETQLLSELSFRCPDICNCPSNLPTCQDGVPLVLDGCGCCMVCARQQGDVCNSIQVCDASRKLQCIYADPFSTSGICRVRRGQSCHVGQSMYRDGETFKLDCRTQCTCQNGTYGCVSLCPHENVRPSSRCHHPQLVKMHGSCCREWLCDSTILEDRKQHCQSYTSDWTPCSKSCDVGISTRISNNNPECQLKNETRLCTLRPCPSFDEPLQISTHGHHVRKNHLCRATVRSTHPVRLTDGGNCTSVELFQPKYCGTCTTHQCCHPKVTTSKKIQFRCIDDEGTNIMQKDVLWIMKCNCTDIC